MGRKFRKVFLPSSLLGVSITTRDPRIRNHRTDLRVKIYLLTGGIGIFLEKKFEGTNSLGKLSPGGVQIPRKIVPRGVQIPRKTSPPPPPPQGGRFASWGGIFPRKYSPPPRKISWESLEILFPVGGDFVVLYLYVYIDTLTRNGEVVQRFLEFCLTYNVHHHEGFMWGSSKRHFYL